MTVLKRTVQVSASVREVTESVTCDLCGKTFQMPDDGSDGVEWLGNHGYGDVAITCVQIGRGYTYPDCHSVEYRAYHVCPECFEAKLEPWLKSQGAKPTEREVDW